jgi:hypothetical protein
MVTRFAALALIVDCDWRAPTCRAFSFSKPRSQPVVPDPRGR